MLGQLLKNIEVVSEEVSSHDLEASGGVNYINDNGVYPVTIERAFMTNTKKGGVQLDLHFGGENVLNTRLYIVSKVQSGKDKGKMITTCKMQGKTVSLPDFKMLKQLYFVATTEAKDLSEIETKVETIKFKEYGKDVEVEGETLVDLIGKQINIAVRLEEEYAYDKETKSADKTELKTDKNGDIVYKKSLDDVFTIEGLHAVEVLKETEEPKLMKKKEEFLASDKATKRLVLEIPEEEEIEEDELPDDLEF
jgi:hypothetical protein